MFEGLAIAAILKKFGSVLWKLRYIILAALIAFLLYLGGLWVYHSIRNTAIEETNAKWVDSINKGVDEHDKKIHELETASKEQADKSKAQVDKLTSKVDEITQAYEKEKALRAKGKSSVSKTCPIAELNSVLPDRMFLDWNKYNTVHQETQK